MTPAFMSYEDAGAEFASFARRLSDVVTVAINNGRRLAQTVDGFAAGTCCPLGCLPTSKFPFPCSGEAFRMWGINWEDAAAFISGYANEEHQSWFNAAYYELGCAYRERFAPREPS